MSARGNAWGGFRRFELVSELLKKLEMRVVVLVIVTATLAACGDAPLQAVGERSSDWMNEPEVVTTTLPPATTPRFVDIESLAWYNEDTIGADLSDRDAVIAEVFRRREGDRFIQASRAEIVAALPDVQFPAVAPYGAAWISSQLVIENSGVLSRDPTAAFGIWSAEPYTRSRSVAQMAIFRVMIDPETAAEVAERGEDITCARFQDRSTNVCDTVSQDGRQLWELIGSGGTTLIWFEDDYRYELFGRTFVSIDDLLRMAGEMVFLGELRPVPS